MQSTIFIRSLLYVSNQSFSSANHAWHNLSSHCYHDTTISNTHALSRVERAILRCTGSAWQSDKVHRYKQTKTNKCFIYRFSFGREWHFREHYSCVQYLRYTRSSLAPTWIYTCMRVPSSGSYEIWCPSESFAAVFSYLCMNRGELRQALINVINENRPWFQYSLPFGDIMQYSCASIDEGRGEHSTGK